MFVKTAEEVALDVLAILVICPVGGDGAQSGWLQPTIVFSCRAKAGRKAEQSEVDVQESWIGEYYQLSKVSDKLAAPWLPAGELLMIRSCGYFGTLPRLGISISAQLTAVMQRHAAGLIKDTRHPGSRAVLAI